MTKEELQLLAELEGVELAPQEVPQPPQRAPMPMKSEVIEADTDSSAAPKIPKGTHGALGVVAQPRAVDSGVRQDADFASVMARLRRSGHSRRGI